MRAGATSPVIGVGRNVICSVVTAGPMTETRLNLVVFVRPRGLRRAKQPAADLGDIKRVPDFPERIGREGEEVFLARAEPAQRLRLWPWSTLELRR